MQIIIVKDYDEMSKVAADIFKEQITNKPSSILGLATGGSPIGIYKNIIESVKNGEVSFKDVTTINLDEYVGLGENNDQSYVHFMRETLFNHIDIDIKNTYLPNGKASDLQAECDRYSALVGENRQDIQLLGLGSNGHIAFNEPGTPFDTKTHVIHLTDNTINDNARYFDNYDEVPKTAITMGISNIMNAKKIVIVASGAKKADAVYEMIKGEYSENCPATALQKHDNVTVIVDELAASKL